MALSIASLLAWPEKSPFWVAALLFGTSCSFWLHSKLRGSLTLPFPVVKVEERLGDKDVFSALQRGSKIVRLPIHYK